MRGAWLVSFLMVAMPLAASAATLPIDGSYGNEPGCHYAKTEESSGADIFFLLTPEAVTTASSYCEVKSIGKTTGPAIEAVLACQSEGEEGETDRAAEILADDKTATVSFKDGTVWGPLAKCR